MVASVTDRQNVVPQTKVHLHSWNLTQAEPNGVKLGIAGAADKSVHFRGANWGGTGVAALEGSNVPNPDETTGTDWFPLTDPQGNAISKTADGGEAVIENTLWIRPRLTTPGTSTDVTVYLLSRSA